jgi:hypothetical protein
MDPKNVAPQEAPDQTATEQELEQVAGGREPSHINELDSVSNNPLYTPSGTSGTNPLYKS